MHNKNNLLMTLIERFRLKRRYEAYLISKYEKTMIVRPQEYLFDSIDYWDVGPDWGGFMI